MDATFDLQVYQHHTKKLQAALNALGQDFNTLLSTLQNGAFNSAGMAIKSGGSSPDFLTANTVYYQIAGKLYSIVAAADNALTAAGVQAISTLSVHLVVVDAAGTITTIAGTPAATGPVVPACPITKAVIGALRVTTDGSHTFTAGTTNLDAAGITTVYIDAREAIFMSFASAYPHLPTRKDAGGVDVADLAVYTAQDTLPLNLG